MNMSPRHSVCDVCFFKMNIFLINAIVVSSMAKYEFPHSTETYKVVGMIALTEKMPATI